MSGGSERLVEALYVLLESSDEKMKGSVSEVKCAHAVETRSAIQRDRLSGSSAGAVGPGLSRGEPVTALS